MLPYLSRLTILDALRCPGGLFIRVGGASGFLAVALGAYGAHVLFQQETSVEQGETRADSFDPHNREIFDIANRYHFIHSCALLATPMFKCPLVTGTLLTLGMLVFCGSCYIHVLTGHHELRRATPYGGMLLIAAWLSMMA